jgi:ribokinase
MPVHVVGNACVDVHVALGHLPRPGETRIADGLTEGLGGKGANQAVAAARAGAEVRLYAALGRDDAGARLRALLARERIDCSGVVTLDQVSDRSIVLVERDGENAIVSAIACARAFRPLESTSLPSAVTAGDSLLLQGNLPPEVTAACLDLGRSRGARTIVNPSPLDERSRFPWPVIDLVVANRLEAEAITGHGDPALAAQWLRRKGAGAVVITLGAAGALWHDDHGTALVPARPVTAIDSSGAGDVFCGMLTAALSRTDDLPLAVAAAGDAAALAVTRTGALAACPSRTELSTIFLNHGILP